MGLMNYHDGMEGAFQEGYEQGCADGEDELRDVVERGMYLAAQGALQQLYESIQFDRGLTIKHGDLMQLQGVWSCILHTGVYGELLLVVTEELNRLHGVVYAVQ